MTNETAVVLDREALKKIILDALLCSSCCSGGNTLDHIVDALYDAGVISQECDIPAKKRNVKKKYGTYMNVRLTDEEHERLHDEFPGRANEAIDYLSEYIKMTGKSYKDHNLAIRKWVFDALDEKAAKDRKKADAARVEEGRLSFNLEDIFEKLT